MSPLHSDITKYIELMKSTRYWYDRPSKNSNCWVVVDVFRRFYYHVRPTLFLVTFIVNGVGIYNTPGMGVLDGNLLFVPLSIFSVVTTNTIYINRHQHRKLTTLLNEMFLENDEPWMVEIKTKYAQTTWKFLKVVIAYQSFCAAFYVVAPLVVDTVLHYGFDYLETPFFFPLTFSVYLPSKVTWDFRYYFIILLNSWAGFETIANLQGFIVCYTVMTVFSLTEIVILKEKIKSLDFDGSADDTKKQFEMIVNRHNGIIGLNRELKTFLGPICAFQSLFTSLVLTLTVFTMTVTPDIPVIIAYAAGCFFYFAAGLLYCSLGQLLENESSKVFETLNDLPWYRLRPEVRKNLNMMIRQALSPLIIDYHGHSKMNLENFMQILRSAYSYFTLLQSMTSSE